MLITSKFILDNEIAGYVINDSGLEFSVTQEGLYDRDILDNLNQSGYKILNYHGDIITPDGINIKDFAVEPYTGSEDEMQTILDMADYCLTEAEAAEFFSRDINVEKIEMKSPVAIEIATREELIAYLEKCKKNGKLAVAGRDIRPLNSFVAKEALFTVEELAKDSMVRDLFTVIERRRKLSSYADYKRLIKFLIQTGVLNEDHTAENVKSAYLAWGVCGLKSGITKVESRVGVTSSILSKSNAEVSKVQEYGLLDKDGVIHYIGGSIDLSESEDLTLESVTPLKAEEYYDLLRNTSNWTTEYMPIQCLVTHYLTRMYIEMMDESGLTATCKVDSTRLAISDSRGVIYYGEFLFVAGLNGSYLSIEQVITPYQYQKYNLLMAKAVDIIRDRTVTSPIKNSFDLLISEGVSPEAAIRYIIRRLQKINEQNGMKSDINYFSAVELYKQGPSKNLIKKYNPNEYEYETQDELIEIMGVTRDEMMSNGEYLQTSNNNSSNLFSDFGNELVERPIENLEFVKMVKEGRISVDNIEGGKVCDGNADLYEVVELLFLVLEIRSAGAELPITKMTEDIANIENLGIIDIDKTIHVRDALFHGYLRDRALLNAARATQSGTLVYITNVFREMANLPADGQRHYMFECLKVSTATNTIGELLLNELAENVRIGIQETEKMDSEVRSLLSIEAPAIAAKLLFKIYFSNSHTEAEGGNILLEERMILYGAENVIGIRVKSDTIRKIKSNCPFKYRYCSLQEWCEYEMTGEFAFNYYCVNANINPWYVSPKSGYEIPAYGFGINYIKDEVMRVFSEGFQLKIEEEKAKIRCICDEYEGNSLFDEEDAQGNTLPNADITKIETVYEDSTVDSLLEMDIDEDFKEYYTRFLIHNESAKKNGKYLEQMCLKSDISFNGYGNVYGITAMKEDTYRDLNAIADASQFLSQSKPSVLRMKINNERALLGGNSIKPFEINEEVYHDIVRWTDLLNGNFVPNGLCMYSANMLIYLLNGEKSVIDLSTLTKKHADDFVDRGVLYKLSANRYLIMTVSGNYSMEVLQ